MSKDDAGQDRDTAENERQYRVVDLLLSMHASLRENYERRAFWLNTMQIGTSLFLCVFAFVSDNVFESWGYRPEIARLTIALFAIVILLLAITEFRVDWRTVASRHNKAVQDLAKLKALFRRKYSGGRGNEGRRPAFAELTTEYERMMESLPPIPEGRFGQLKARHEFKRLVSRRLSENPKAPGWFLRAQLRLEGMVSALRRKNDGTTEESKR